MLKRLWGNWSSGGGGMEVTSVADAGFVPGKNCVHMYKDNSTGDVTGVDIWVIKTVVQNFIDKWNEVGK